MPAVSTNGRYPLPEAGCTLVRIEPGRTRTSTGHELTVGLDGQTLYLPTRCDAHPECRHAHRHHCHARHLT